MTSLRVPRSLIVGCCASAMILGASCSDSSSSPPLTIASAHVNVPLLDRYGKPVEIGTTEPYSPRNTCGPCHDIEQIANGYHFQQGRTNLAGKIITKPNYFEDGREHLLSAGMYGKW